jgi:hypothetical protein
VDRYRCWNNKWSWDVQVTAVIKFACYLACSSKPVSLNACRWYCVSQHYLGSVTLCSVVTITCIYTVSKFTMKPTATCVCCRLCDHFSSVTLPIEDTWIDYIDSVGCSYYFFSYCFICRLFDGSVSFTEVMQPYNLEQPCVTTNRQEDC